jgi:WD40 repeat protein
VIYEPFTAEMWDMLVVPTDPEQVRGVETDPGIYHPPSDVDAVAWSPGSRLLAAGAYNGMINLWDISTGAVVARLDDIGAGKSLDWHPNGQYLAIGTYEGVVILWDVSRYLE